ncbi:MAG: hypothetical protein E6K80_04700 [Candidatus Eisenbacteria bacterium]|uniref:Peptidase S11 D-alanyl-D-alanine carboxypeptidase A N-terminal domain-containing protein n=1 Tax=Eiseniibacteriota bacterium TaxID=2212470 RepID=A0A538U787_UNCEI|nr:MAG: hypothetical protein E6K80_04700 [Candidatus Eisenbacteria bacterium]
MSLCARRPHWRLLLVAFLALPAMTAEAAITVQPIQPTILASSSGASRKHVRRAHRRRRRAPPPGGVYASHAVVLDPSTDEILYDKNSAESVPIASLSKLMTDMVFLEQKPDLDREVQVAKEDLQGAGRTHLRASETLALRDLLHMSLMCSPRTTWRR